MGFIQVPKLIQGGGGDEPTIHTREMPQSWRYFTSLKESPNDQAYLMFKGASGAFTISGVNATNTTVTLYGGTNGTTPLYRYIYTSSSTNRKWYHWDSTLNDWVENSTQAASSYRTSNAKIAYGDIVNHPLPFGMSLYDLQGFPITNDPHLGTTELFTVIVHKPNASAQSTLIADSFYGTAAANGAFAIPVVAYSGDAKGIKTSMTNVFTRDLEFIEITGGTTLNTYEIFETSYASKVTIPNTVTALNTDSLGSNPNLQEVVLGTGVTNIPLECFSFCRRLRKVTMNGNVTSIGDHGFYYTHGLESINFPSTLTSIGNDAFFFSGIKEAKFSSGLTTIGNSAFSDCYSLKEVSLPNTVTSLGNGTFVNCYKLEKITLPNNISTIPDNMCDACYNLEEVNIPSSVTYIGASAFSNCSFTNLVLPNNLATIANGAFQDNYMLQEVTIPNSVTFVDSNAFSGNKSLKKINIGSQMSSIPSYFAYQCKSLTKCDIPEGIESIGASAFGYDNAMRSYILPSTLLSIGINCFTSNGACLYYFLKSTTPPDLTSVNAFGSSNTYMKIFVPYENINDYQTATNWSSTTNNIKTRQRGWGYFTASTTLPLHTTDGLYDLTWYDNLGTIINTAHNVKPSTAGTTVAGRDGNYYCYFTPAS